MRAVLQPQSRIFYLITLYDTYNIEQNKPDTVHKGTVFDIENQSGPG